MAKIHPFYYFFQLCRTFLAIVKVHHSRDYILKLRSLRHFKHILSANAQEFCDDQQKVSHLLWCFFSFNYVPVDSSLNPTLPLCVQDAHEFLITFLSQVQNLSPLLQCCMQSIGKGYTCPVDHNFLFQMETTRMCRR